MNITGQQKTPLDNFLAVDSYILTEQPEVIYIPVINHFKEVSEKKFGSFYQGMIASAAKTGQTLTDDNTHWNDMGSSLMASLLLPLFDF